MYWVSAYFFISFYSLIGLYLYKSEVSIQISKYFAIISVVSASLFVFCINLNRDIMSDSIGYEIYFNLLQQVDYLNIITYKDNFEIGFRLWTWLIGCITSNVKLFFALTSLLIYIVTTLSLFNIFDKYVSMFTSTLYIGLPWFALYSSSGIRQGLALAFLVLTISYLMKSRKTISFIFLLIAASFHKTAFFFLPVYIVVILNLSIRTGFIIYALFIIGSFFNIFQSLIVSFFDVNSLTPRERVYFSGENESYRTGFRLDFSIFSIFPLFIYYFIRKLGLTNNKLDKWVMVYLSLNAFMHLFSFVPYYDRIAAFSWYLYPVLYSMMMFRIKDKLISFLGLALFSIANIFVFRFYNWGWYFGF